MFAGLVGALLAVAYLVYAFLATEQFYQLQEDAIWRTTLAVVVLPGTALVVGHLRERFELLLVREREARAAAEAAQERISRILESISDGFVALDRGWRVTYVNRAAEEMLQRPRARLLGKDVREEFPDSRGSVFFQNYERAMAEQAPVRFEARSLLRDVWFEVHAYPAPDSLTVYFRDVTERRRHEEELRSLSLIDELTGLYNRRGFHTLAEQQCRVAERKQRELLLIFADVDNLKEINDTHGHTAGDRALHEIAAILQRTLRESDIVARIGGDEFAALALDTEPNAAPILLSRLQDNVRTCNAQANRPFQLSLSVGTASFDPSTPASVEDLLALADRRMYRQKREKRS